MWNPIAAWWSLRRIQMNPFLSLFLLDVSMQAGAMATATFGLATSAGLVGIRACKSGSLDVGALIDATERALGGGPLPQKPGEGGKRKGERGRGKGEEVQIVYAQDGCDDTPPRKSRGRAPVEVTPEPWPHPRSSTVRTAREAPVLTLSPSGVTPRYMQFSPRRVSLSSITGPAYGQARSRFPGVVLYPEPRVPALPHMEMFEEDCGLGMASHAQTPFEVQLRPRELAARSPRLRLHPY